jgi:hypothetical protein
VLCSAILFSFPEGVLCSAVLFSSPEGVLCSVIFFHFMSSLFSALNTAVIRAPGMDPLKMPLSTEGFTVDDISVWEWSSRLVRFKEGLKTFETFLPYFLSFRGSAVSME